ncbi:MAG: hypothetical protein ABSH41_24360 [Syntrophobacteraceae bacterium]|jgi:hypothetical protein
MIKDVIILGPIHVAAYIEGLQKKIAVPSVKLQLVAIRMRVEDIYVQGRRKD